jgi:hypothetical protein
VAAIDRLIARGRISESILSASMHTDPVLLVFLAGVLVGAAIMVLTRRIPDVVFLARHILDRRRARDRTWRRYFLG